jgi:creatinine amidohydrolase
MVAIKLAEDAAKETNVIVTPPLWFGWSPHHLALPGTVSIRPEVLIEMLFDVVSSLASHGFSRFVVVNGHRIGNVPWIQIAAEKAQHELDVKVIIYDPAYMSKEIVDRLGFGEVGHAEEIETSHMLHIMPQAVEMEKARDYLPRERKLYHVDPRIPKDTMCYVPGTARELDERSEESGSEESGGGHGRPTLASADKGRQLHEHLLARLIEVIKELKDAHSE